MEKDIIFFSAEGLTSTSANFVANLAKEYYQSLEIALEKLTFYRTTVELLSSDVTKTLKEGTTLSQLKKVPAMLEDIAKAKSLIAWLREAIKARENLITEVRNLSLSEWCVNNHLAVPERPERGDVLTEDEYFGSLGIKERNAYYALETQCSTLGKFIHPNGHFADARAEMKETATEPHKLIGSGRDATIYNYEVTVSSEDVDTMFYELQKKYRELQANLNSIKFSCQKAIEESETKVNSEYAEAVDLYNNEVNALNAKLTKWKKEQQIAIGNLKIAIPDNLKSIYSKISALGNK